MKEGVVGFVRLGTTRRSVVAGLKLRIRKSKGQFRYRANSLPNLIHSRLIRTPARASGWTGGGAIHFGRFDCAPKLWPRAAVHHVHFQIHKGSDGDYRWIRRSSLVHEL